MRQSNRLIINTVAVYGRMAVTVGIGLLTTRLALQALHADAFGLYALILGTVGTLGIFSNAFMASVARHLAHEIGRGEPERIRRTFNTALGLTLVISLGALAAGLALEKPVLAVLEISPELREASAWMYRWCVLFVAIGIFGNLFSTTLASHQSIVLCTFVDIYQSAAQLGVLLLLAFLPGDRAIVYAALLTGVQATVCLMVIVSCLVKFPLTRPSLVTHFSREEAQRIGGFTGWAMLGQVSDTLGSMGWQWVLNLGFGTTVNAAMAIVQRLAGYQKSLAWAMTTPLRPAICAIDGRGDLQNLHRLVLVAGKYPVLIMLFYLVPVQFEVETLLALWLKDVPEHTAALVRLVLVGIALGGLGSGLDAAVVARGRIGGYTLLLAIPSFLVLGVAGVMILKFGAPPWTLPAVGLAFGVLTELARAAYVGRMIGLPVASWLRWTVLPVVAVAGVGAAAAGMVHEMLEPGLVRLLAVTGAYGVAAVPVIWWGAMSAWEREHFSRVAGSGLRRVWKYGEGKAPRMQPPTPDPAEPAQQVAALPPQTRFEPGQSQER